MKIIFDTNGPHNCLGCRARQEGANGAVSCQDGNVCAGDTRPNPPCYQYPLEYQEAMNEHRRLRDALGRDHPVTQEAQVTWMRMAPPPVRARLTQIAVDIGLIPPPYAITESGVPLFRHDEVAEALGLGPTEAEAIPKGQSDSAVQCSADFDPHAVHLLH